jgi:phosphate transport system substrate-binding protein
MKNIHSAGLHMLLFSLIVSMFSACQSGNQAYNETPTRGNIKIIADESYQPIIDSEIHTFTSLYPYAKITPIYKPEVDVINDFINDSVKVIVTNRKLTDAQIKYLRDTLAIARTTTIAYDAVAILINKSNKDTAIDYNSIRDVFQGKITKWSEINPKSNLGKISVVFDNTKSGNVRFMKEKFDIKTDLGENFYALKTNEEVINYISKTPGAMGIISVNWISDKDDSTSSSFIKRIKVAAISHPYLADGNFYRPYQASIYTKSYPFVREVYFISRESFAGLGSGLISWVAAEQGQRIILKSGLVPSTMPIRLIQIKQ